jgi:hypothetical protein
MPLIDSGASSAFSSRSSETYSNVGPFARVTREVDAARELEIESPAFRLQRDHAATGTRELCVEGRPERGGCG